MKSNSDSRQNASKFQDQKSKVPPLRSAHTLKKSRSDAKIPITIQSFCRRKKYQDKYYSMAQLINNSETSKVKKLFRNKENIKGQQSQKLISRPPLSELHLKYREKFSIKQQFSPIPRLSTGSGCNTDRTNGSHTARSNGSSTARYNGAYTARSNSQNQTLGQATTTPKKPRLTRVKSLSRDFRLNPEMI